MQKKRTQIPFKLDRLTEKEQIMVNRWADKQQNMQNSFTSIVLHMINRYGYVDFMDFDVQRELFTESLGTLSVQEPKETMSTSQIIPEANKIMENKQVVNAEDEDDDEFDYNEELEKTL